MQILRMPYEQAVETGEAEAEAAGWEPFALPLTMELDRKSVV